VIRGFPDPTTAHLGLLLISESAQGRGIGRVGYMAIEDVIRSWAGCRCVRIGVVRTNEGVIAFWKKVGFAETGEVKPYCYGTVVSETIILTKALH
jgi:ribosomal protein S18 acetylase RimI-like enzyme